MLRKNTILISAILLLTIFCFLSVGLCSPLIIETAAKQKLLPIYSVKQDAKVIAISFDAAWNDEDIDSIIKTLNDYAVKTTFFVVGSWINKYPVATKKLSDNGHEIANHSDTHAHMATQTKTDILKELSECDTKIYKVTGKNIPLFRAPYGEYNDLVIKTVSDAGYYNIQWDVDSLDWKDLSTEEIVNRVIKRVAPGSIVLFHNGTKNTYKALPIVLDRLIKDGYKIVPVSELIMKKNYSINHAGKQIPN